MRPLTVLILSLFMSNLSFAENEDFTPGVYGNDITFERCEGGQLSMGVSFASYKCHLPTSEGTAFFNVEIAGFGASLSLMYFMHNPKISCHIHNAEKNISNSQFVAYLPGLRAGGSAGWGFRGALFGTRHGNWCTLHGQGVGLDIDLSMAMMRISLIGPN